MGSSKSSNKGRRRSKSWTQVKFPRIVEAERNAYGTYRLTRIVLRHDHTLDSPDDDAEPEHEETPNIASTSSFTPLAGTSYSCTAPSIFTTGRQPSPRFPRLQFDTAQELQPASPARPPPLAFFDDLKALISFLMPNLAPVSASRLASQLIGTGIRSISDLTNFLLFETDTTLPCFLRGLARREGDDVAEDAFSLFQLMRMYSMDSA
ncbi:transcription factor, FAR1-related domain-containing protein [Rhodotorula toruloides]|uniref:Transcription factor, FAR1-related domain-containing protein n=1 Tax=Rhodotorula toruloides TaxID=5286 RepID=A0A511KPD1_RHOTO|nr:transcription factor, FAR1-related domain-containing protein [Rhodotorula toruloides]